DLIVADDIATRADLEHEDVGAALTEQHVVAGPAVQTIISGTAQQVVAARIADQAVVQLIADSESRGALKDQILDIGIQIDPAIGDAHIRMDGVDSTISGFEGEVVTGVHP